MTGHCTIPMTKVWSQASKLDADIAVDGRINIEEGRRRLQQTALGSRSKIGITSSTTDVSKSTLDRNMETIVIRIFPRKLKPVLCEQNRKDRLR